MTRLPPVTEVALADSMFFDSVIHPNVVGVPLEKSSIKLTALVERLTTKVWSKVSLSLLTIVSDPATAPIAEGVVVTVIVVLAPGVSVPVPVPTREKPVPLNVAELMVRFSAPWFSILTEYEVVLPTRGETRVAVLLSACWVPSTLTAICGPTEAAVAWDSTTLSKRALLAAAPVVSQTRFRG